MENPMRQGTRIIAGIADFAVNVYVASAGQYARVIFTLRRLRYWDRNQFWCQLDYQFCVLCARQTTILDGFFLDIQTRTRILPSKYFLSAHH